MLIWGWQSPSVTDHSHTETKEALDNAAALASDPTPSRIDNRDNGKYYGISATGFGLPCLSFPVTFLKAADIQFQM